MPSQVDEARAAADARAVAHERDRRVELVVAMRRLEQERRQLRR